MNNKKNNINNISVVTTTINMVFKLTISLETRRNKT